MLRRPGNVCRSPLTPDHSHLFSSNRIKREIWVWNFKARSEGPQFPHSYCEGIGLDAPHPAVASPNRKGKQMIRIGDKEAPPTPSPPRNRGQPPLSLQASFIVLTLLPRSSDLTHRTIQPRHPPTQGWGALCLSWGHLACTSVCSPFLSLEPRYKGGL